MQAFNKAGQPQFRGKTNIPNYSDWLVIDSFSGTPRSPGSLTCTAQVTAELVTALSQASTKGTLFEKVVVKIFASDGRHPFVPNYQFELSGALFDFSIGPVDGNPNPIGAIIISYTKYTVVFSDPNGSTDNRNSAISFAYNTGKSTR